MKPMIILLTTLYLVTGVAIKDTFGIDKDVLRSEIYSALSCCPCDIALVNCSCEEAKEIKSHIEELINSGLTRDEIFYNIAKKFSLNVIADDNKREDIEGKLRYGLKYDYPQVFLESKIVDFGRVSKRQGDIKKTIKLYNKGKENLIINNIKVSCNCVRVSLRSKDGTFDYSPQRASLVREVIIKPSHSAELDISLDMKHPSVGIGKLIREIYIESNDPVYPEFTIRVVAKVEE